MDEQRTDAVLTNAIPNDSRLLEMVGRVAIRHAQLDHMLKMAIKSICDVSVEDALDATNKAPTAELRRRVLRLARRRFGDGPVLVQLQALLDRCRRASDRRHALLHGMWAGRIDSQEFFVRSEHQRYESAPSAEEVRELSKELLALGIELNEARLEGFIANALAASKPLSLV